MSNLLTAISTIFCSSLIAVMSIFATMSYCDASDVQSSEMMKTVVSQHCVEVLSNADTVTVYSWDNKDKVVYLGQDQIDALKKMIVSDDSYAFDFQKEAVFIPSTVFVFKQGQHEVTLTFSMHAEQLEFECGEQLVMIDCDPITTQLAAFSNGLFRG